MDDSTLFGTVIGNEVTARIMLSELQKRGMTITRNGKQLNQEDLSHDELAEVLIRVTSELKRIELQEKRNGKT